MTMRFSGRWIGVPGCWWLLAMAMAMVPAMLPAAPADAVVAVDWRRACGVLDGSGVRARVQRSADGSFKRCRSHAVQFGTAQPVRAAIRYSVLSDSGVVSEARLVLEVRSQQDVQQAYAQLRSMAAKVVPAILAEPLPEEIGVAIMEGIFGREWPVGSGRVELRRSGGGRVYQLELRVYP